MLCFSMFSYSQKEIILFTVFETRSKRSIEVYRVLSGDGFESSIFFLQLLLAVALDRSLA
jgi:hypothetical protein